MSTEWKEALGNGSLEREGVFPTGVVPTGGKGKEGRGGGEATKGLWERSQKGRERRSRTVERERSGRRRESIRRGKGRTKK